MTRPLWEIVCQFLKKLNTYFLYNPKIPHPRMYLTGMKTCIHTNKCTWIFMAALFIIAPNWKQPKYLLTGEWVNKMYNCHCISFTDYLLNEYSEDGVKGLLMLIIMRQIYSSIVPLFLHMSVPWPHLVVISVFCQAVGVGKSRQWYGRTDGR